ncbi:MAG: ankyrin repeat domain-containing protein [bacterium]
MNKKIFICFLLIFLTIININCFKIEEESDPEKTIEVFEITLKNDSLDNLAILFDLLNKKHIKDLLQHKLSFVQEAQWTCLHYTIIHNLTSLAKFIIQKMKFFNLDLNVRDSNNNTALHFAAMRGNIEIAKLLIRNGAKVEIQNLQDETALDKATQCKQTDMIKFLSDKKDSDEIDFFNISDSKSESSSDESICISDLSDSEESEEEKDYVDEEEREKSVKGLLGLKKSRGLTPKEFAKFAKKFK